MGPDGTEPAADMVRAEGLVRRFGELAAVDGLSFAVAEGEIFGLIGPDGAGKTTTLRMLAGLLDPSAGQAWIGGLPAGQGGEALAATIGYMPQRFGLYVDLTVAENLAFFAELRELPRAGARARMDELLGFVGLAEFHDRLAGALSGGMKQKLALACALVHVPPVLLLDEPTNGVDPVSRRDFWRLLYRLVRERRTTIVVATAYLDEAERCGRLAMLDRGRAVAIADPAGLRARLPGQQLELRPTDARQAAALPPPLFPADATPAVSIRGLERRFGDFVAVGGISLDVAAGEIFGFLGPNGAGKSTTIRMLCGLLAPSAGTGTVAGFDIRTEQDAIKRRIGYMSQRFSLYDDLTVAENLDFFGSVYGLAGARLARRQAEVLALAGLAELAERRDALTGTLPGGLKQRLALGAAVLHEPPLLFLDEPTSGTDPLGRRAFWDLIHDLAARGVTVFVTTHYMEEAEYCDRLALIYRGEMVAAGTPAELKTTHMADAIVEIRCERPAERMDALAALPGVREVALFGRGLHAVAERAAAEAVLAAVRAALADEAGARAELVPPTMEDVFVSLVEARDRQEARR